MKDELLEAMNPCEPYTAGELADVVDEPRRTVDYHLRQLAEDGEIMKKKHSHNRVSWWRTDE